MSDPSPPVLADVVRGDLVESRHRGHLVAQRPDGSTALSLGEPSAAIYPRSCVKPIQLAAMLDAGLSTLGLDDAALAVATASHSGEDRHVEQVRRILTAADLREADLQNTPGMPLSGSARRAMLRSGVGPDRIHHNCSGKHAAMLATCVAAGWPTATYRDPGHPLQVAIRCRIEAMADEPVSAVSVDGCGAALFAISTAGLARAFLSLVNGSGSAASVVAAMRHYPDLVGGDGREVTELMQAVDGLIAKDGAEGVFAVAARDVGAVAVKIEDGASRPLAPVVVRTLHVLGVDSVALQQIGRSPVLGHGEPVGEVKPLL